MKHNFKNKRKKLKKKREREIMLLNGEIKKKHKTQLTTLIVFYKCYKSDLAIRLVFC